jgi:hypothetical protein
MIHMPTATVSASAAVVGGRMTDAEVIGGVLYELRPDVAVMEALLAVVLSDMVVLNWPWV